MEQKLQFDFATTQRIIQKIGQIDQFKGEWKNIDQEENKYLKELRKIATIQSIGSSTRIEGSSLSDAEIASLIKNMKVNKLQTRDEQEVAGYYDTLDTILSSYEHIDISISNIHSLHNLLLKYSGKDTRHRGQFKELTNQVVATYPDGTARVIFKTTEPYLVSKEMDDLVKWTNESLASKAVHPLMVIGTFVYEFLSIHPYQDGNGRLSRLLTNLLLLNADYKFVQYVSLEHIVEGKKADYYQALMEGQKDRYSVSERIDRWLLFFFDCLLELINKLERKVADFKQLGGHLNDRQRDVLTYIQNHQPVKIGDISKNLSQYSIASLRKDLQYLVKELAIEKLGESKGTIYIIKQK